MRLPGKIALAALLALTPAPASGAEPTPVRELDLTKVVAKGAVVDTTLPKVSRRLRRQEAPVPGRTETFVDEHGHSFTISTAIPDVDLRPFADVLAATRHGDELPALRSEAVHLADMERLCGDPQAVACYGADDPDSLPEGKMIFAVDDPDVIHTIVHEYGHHHDNQLLNLRHLDMGCGFNNDGSRNWFFARQVEDDILEAGVSCDPEADWEHLLGEVFAEDFVALNGIDNWSLRSVRSPTSTQLAAMEADIAQPFRTEVLTAARFVRKGRSRTVSLDLDNWTFVDIRLRGPRAADLDLWLYPDRGNKAIAKSRRRGSTERIQTLLPPGSYDVDIYAFRRAGGGRLKVHLQ